MECALLFYSENFVKDLMKRQVIRELQKLTDLKLVIKPSSGWIRTIREALGMTAEQLGKRLHAIQQRVSAIEKAEPIGALRIKTLEEVALALNCDLVYFLVPKQPIEKMLERQAYKIARKRIEQSSHSMDLEEQSISEEEKRRQIDKLAKELLVKKSKELWSDE